MASFLETQNKQQVKQRTKQRQDQLQKERFAMKQEEKVPTKQEELLKQEEEVAQYSYFKEKEKAQQQEFVKTLPDFPWVPPMPGLGTGDGSRGRLQGGAPPKVGYQRSLSARIRKLKGPTTASTIGGVYTGQELRL